MREPEIYLIDKCFKQSTNHQKQTNKAFIKNSLN